MNSIDSLIQQSNPYSEFIDQLVMIESQKKGRLEDQKTQLNDKQSALSDVSSTISDFTSQVDELTSNTSNSFNPLTATSSNENAIRVDSISGLEDPNTYDISVTRKATKDIILSNVMDGSATDLTASGDGSVDITIGDKTETINVTATNDDGTDKTNKEMLESFSTAINDLLGEESDSDVFEVDNNGNVQISVKSAQTGYDERVQFNNATGALTDITNNMNHKVVDDGGTLNDLDAEFTADGITFTRGQNTVDDAISGMTFTLVDATAQQEQITVSKDTDKARENVDDFISKFNEMNTHIRNQTFVNGETGNKGPLQDKRSIRNLTLNMRQTALTDMASAGAGELANLSEIGIGFENDGTMNVEDSELLSQALSEKPTEVENLFTNDDSPVTRMYEQAKTFTGTGGTLSSLESGLDQKIDFLDNRIESEEKYLERYEERQRETFAEINQMQQEGQQQFNQVMDQQSTLGF